MDWKLLPAMLLAVGAGLQARAAEPADAAIDSVSVAAATITGDMISSTAQREYGADSVAHARFIQGVLEAFQVNSENRPYYHGVLEGQRLASQLDGMMRNGLPINPQRFLDAFDASAHGKPTAMTKEQAQTFMTAFIKTLQGPSSQAAATDTVSEASQMAFLAEKAKRRGVKVMPSGLEFEVVSEGKGAQPGKSDRVRVTYTGRLADGTVFDSADEPVEFAVSRMIPGFSEGLTMMKPGGTYRLYIPASLGYGARGIPGTIPGNAVLDFEVKMLEVLPADK